MKAESNKDVKKWLQKHAEIFLAEIGIRKGQIVLDFGCNEGNYTIPAARIIGEKGKVYAIDKEGKSLIKRFNSQKVG